MSTSPSLEIQTAIVNRLKGHAAVLDLVSGRIYDSIPKDSPFPYVSMGPVDELDGEDDCIRSYDISLQIDCWSRKPGFPEVKNLSNAVRDALHDHDFALEANAPVYFVHRQTRIFRDPDGLTSHAVMTFETLIEQPQQET